jgi:hypothetical protein
VHVGGETPLPAIFIEAVPAVPGTFKSVPSTFQLPPVPERTTRDNTFDYIRIIGFVILAAASFCVLFGGLRGDRRQWTGFEY